MSGPLLSVVISRTEAAALIGAGVRFDFVEYPNGLVAYLDQLTIGALEQAREAELQDPADFSELVTAIIAWERAVARGEGFDF